jgi:prephenate dehydrogenase
MRVAFLGFGLIGGSIARALRARAAAAEALAADRWQIAAWTPTGAGPAAGSAAGVVDVVASTPEEALAGADLVVLAAPAPDCLAMLDDLAGPWRSSLGPDAVITDVASSKSALVLRATALGLRFVGGHPMAGRETSGFIASDADLLVDRPWVVVPTADAAATERVEFLVRATGARPVRLAAGAHDAAVAGISHLPLLASVALVEAVAGDTDGPREDWPMAAVLAASGWRDTTRLARGDVAMGTGIIVTNADAIAARVRDTIVALEGWLVELERPGGPDRGIVAERLQAARDRLEAMAR